MGFLRTNLPAPTLLVASHKRPPWWIGVNEVIVLRSTPSTKNPAILAEAQMAWLGGAGEPPRSVAITWRGIALLERDRAPL
jgi:hypothetical protein